MIILLSKDEVSVGVTVKTITPGDKPRFVHTVFDELELGLLVDIYIVEEGKHIKEQNEHAKNPVRRR